MDGAVGASAAEQEELAKRLRENVDRALSLFERPHRQGGATAAQKAMDDCFSRLQKVARKSKRLFTAAKDVVNLHVQSMMSSLADRKVALEKKMAAEVEDELTALRQRLEDQKKALLAQQLDRAKTELISSDGLSEEEVAARLEESRAKLAQLLDSEAQKQESDFQERIVAAKKRKMERALEREQKEIDVAKAEAAAAAAVAELKAAQDEATHAVEAEVAQVEFELLKIEEQTIAQEADTSTNSVPVREPVRLEVEGVSEEEHERLMREMEAKEKARGAAVDAEKLRQAEELRGRLEAKRKKLTELRESQAAELQAKMLATEERLEDMRKETVAAKDQDAEESAAEARLRAEFEKKWEEKRRKLDEEEAQRMEAQEREIAAIRQRQDDERLRLEAETQRLEEETKAMVQQREETLRKVRGWRG